MVIMIINKNITIPQFLLQMSKDTLKAGCLISLMRDVNKITELCYQILRTVGLFSDLSWFLVEKCYSKRVSLHKSM